MTTVSNPINKIPSFVSKTNLTGHHVTPKSDPYQPLIAIYLLRLALGLKDQLSFTALENFYDESKLGLITGLAPSLTDKDVDEESDEAPLATEEEQIYRQFDQQLNHWLNQDMQVDAPLFSNVQNLAIEFQLSPAEQELLVLSLLMAGNRKFNDYLCEYCSSSDTTSIADYLCLMTNRPIEEIKSCLKHTGRLFRAGWLEVIEYLDPSRLLVPPSLLYQLFDKPYSIQQLRQIFFKSRKHSALTLDAYPKLKNDLDVVIPYLQNAIEHQISGVNLLIYGASAHGKRELARLIAKLVDTPLVEIPNIKANDRSLEPEDRFAACQSTQIWLTQHAKTELIVFDEADTIFPPTSSNPIFGEEDNERIPGITPSLLKPQLAKNPLPIIWIIDKPNKMAAEYLHAFDYALEVEKMPDQLRHQRIVKATQDLDVSPSWQQQLTKRVEVPLNQIKKAAAIAKLSKTDDGLTSDEQILEQVLNSHSRLFNRPSTFQHFKPVTSYDLQFTNTSIALDDLVKGLKRHPHGNFCFFGAPGTGKTAFAKHLADQLGMPILIKRASDILNKYLGDSEKNIARMFREAKRDGAILLLDEADTFLSDRNSNRYSWENSKINEMLVQMESFEGIFICTTNLMERMDSASLRRFDFKVKFDYLNAEQRWGLFAQESQRLGAKLPDDAQSLQTIQQQIQRLSKLTPGDFAVLSRQSKFQEQPFTLSEMLNILQQECVAKGEQFSRIGFVH